MTRATCPDVLMCAEGLRLDRTGTVHGDSQNLQHRVKPEESATEVMYRSVSVTKGGGVLWTTIQYRDRSYSGVPGMTYNFFTL